MFVIVSTIYLPQQVVYYLFSYKARFMLVAYYSILILHEIIFVVFNYI